MFYIIGLGLGDAKDITVKGLEIVKKCDRVYLESYTSLLTIGQEELVSILRLCLKYMYILFEIILGKILWEKNNTC